MDRESARAAARDRRRTELFGLLEDPEANGWPDLARGRLIRGAEGVTKTALARALGCSPQSLVGLLSSPTGEVLSSRTTGLHQVYDPNLLFLLADHPKVVASRTRRLVTVVDADRRNSLDILFSSASRYEIVHVEITSFRTIQWVSFGTSTLSVLFGKNGAGKSSILDAIRTQFNTPDAGETDPCVELAVRFVTDSSADEAQVTAAYLALGVRSSLIDDIEDLITLMLRSPIAYGHNEHWLLGVDPTVGERGRKLSNRLMGSVGSLKGRLLQELVEASYRAVDEPQPIPSMALALPSVAVSTLSSDPGTLERRLFDQIGSTVDPISERLGTLTRGAPLLAGNDEDQEPGTPSRDAADADADRCIIEWIDEDEEPCPPHRAFSVRVTWSRSSESESVALTDVARLTRQAEAIVDRLGPNGENVATYVTLLRLARVIGSGSATSPWATTRPVPRTLAIATALAIEIAANRYCPDFAVDGGRILLSVPGHENAERVEVGILEASGSFRTLAELPSGIARWVALVTDLAASEVLQALSSGGLVHLMAGSDMTPYGEDPDEERLDSLTANLLEHVASLVGRGRALMLLLADEPELHLHPNAQEEIVRWCCSASSRWTTIVATHAPPFLRLGVSEGRIVRVFRHADAGTRTALLEGTVLEELDEIAEGIGLGRDRLLQLVRGLVFVEGLADQAVLMHLAGDLIARQRLVVVPIHGHSQTKGVVQGELALALGLSVAVIFDNITREDLAALEVDPTARVSDEAKSAWRLVSQQERGLDCTVIPFESGDICGALPEATIRQHYPSFTTWDEINLTWASDRARSFKHVFLDALGVSRRADYETIVAIAKGWDGRSPLPHAFVRTLRGLEAWAEAISTG